MNAGAIGVFDSGLGGLTAVKELVRLLPHEDIIFFGDTARVPYGTRNADTILRYSRQDISFLLSENVKLIVVACGTVSSTLPAGFADKLPVPLVTVIAPTAAAAAAATKNGRVGVLGTPATIRSRSFERALAESNGALRVFPQACPLFVPLVENGYVARDCAVTRAVAKEYLAPLKAAGVDTVILGCTHYPLIRDIIADELGGGVALVDAGRETALCAAETLRGRELLGDGSGSLRFFTSDSPEGFVPLAELFLGCAVRGRASAVSVEDIPLHEALL
ncbi:MAG: glutamate racemase [Oscillospiraceae bacterium]|nr:glutamate racemase [Oscillospiraceae bacterium]